ncbi:DUF1559 family PulG-like putative transporter [Urbifossiella limnaea]|uniref:DUF1559 domain-containing protein n=1 Tax=Urbifossiella limnaea TaxID=2528023 RepID=A0A517Y3J3_9BACT|nr:DUF1559 domain-containing protein [Urbifossiella limnaea]QDU24317.1 hypothetical protein ETAA1_63310 [Urbifossiella limnaea]
MSINRTTCPSCGAGLKSAAGFNPGQALRCPKCSTPFTVPAFEVEEDDADAPPPPKKKGPPARAARDDDDDRPRRRRPRDDDDDADDDDRPRKKKKTKYQEYKTSPVRFAVLGVLLVVLGVLAFLLYQKKMKEKEDNAEGPEPAAPVAAGPGGNLGPPPNAPPRANPRAIDPQAGVTPAATWTPYEADGFRVQFPGPASENQNFSKVMENMMLKGGARFLPGPDESFSVVYFTTPPKWPADERAATLKFLSDAILPGQVTERRKVTMAGKEWDEISMTGRVSLERATRRTLDTGDRIIILHATYLKGRETADRFLNSFEFVGPTRPGPKGDGGPKGDKAAAAAERGMNGLKQVMLAMHNHHDVTTAFPPAAVTARDGKALLSWRVKLLPYLEEDELYKQFKLNEPWDSPTNRPLVAKMPAVFQGTLPANDGKTAFKVFVGGGALFDLRQGRQIRNVTDGTSNTLAVVESGPPVEWTRPEDIPFDGKTAPRLVSPTGGDIILAATADGAVGRLSLVRNPADVIVKGITAAGGEVVQFQFERNR